MTFIKEEYKWGVSHDVIEEYEDYIEKGLIRPYDPFDYDPSEDDSNPVWEIVELTEEELLERIAEAKKREERMAKDYLEFKARWRLNNEISF